MRHRYLLFAGLAGAPAWAGCSGAEPAMHEGFVQQASALPTVPGARASSGDARHYRATLRPVDDGRATGAAEIEVVGDRLRVRVRATGVAALEHIPQHIHLNPGCDPSGAVLMNLDAGLTVPGEGQGTGAAYPVASRAGLVQYEASRPLDDLRSALNTWGGTTLDDTAELLAFLDLEDRNIHMHVAFGPPFPAVTCGGIEQIP